MKKVISLLLAIVFVSSFIVSCKTTGYGCNGRSSWNGMIKKANRSY